MDQLEFLSITGDGTIITRHRREDGIIHVHGQRNEIFPDILSPLEAWCASILSLPPNAHTQGTPPFVAALFRKGHHTMIQFAFPFVALDEDAAGLILQEVPEIMLLVHDSDVSCTRSRYERHMKRHREI